MEIVLDRYLFCISFNGAAYCGWQVQKNGVAVQEVVQDALERILGLRHNIVACSRTDAGVHANNFYFHMDLELKIPVLDFIFALNNVLPADIVIKSIVLVKDWFHARYSCRCKEYIYKVYVKPLKNPFLKDLVLPYGRSLDIDNIIKASKFFLGRHNFTSFCSSKCYVQDKVRTIYSIDIKSEDDIVTFKIKGDGFLYNMVRIMIGTLIEVSEGRFCSSDIKDILKNTNRKYAGRTVKASGLYLNEVYY